MTIEVRRVAALYDVHGNLPALEAALADAEAAGVDLFVFGGDLALGPMPCEVLDRLVDLGGRARCLRGNCDRLMVDSFDGRLAGSLPVAIRETIAWAAGQLDSTHRDLLAGLPETLTVAVEGLGAVLFCHATPRCDDEIFTARTPDERLRPMLAGVRERVVVCGHTHMQFQRDLDGVQVVNAGSVGMPYGEAGAHWLLLSPQVEFRRTAYDLASAAEQIANTGYPNAANFAERSVLHPPFEEEMLTALDSPRSA
jgi:putative phosphoesterase